MSAMEQIRLIYAAMEAATAPRPIRRRSPNSAVVVKAMGDAFSGSLAVAMGGGPYDRHRDAYVRTGDPEQLAAMLRHVTVP